MKSLVLTVEILGTTYTGTLFEPSPAPAGPIPTQPPLIAEQPAPVAMCPACGGDGLDKAATNSGPPCPACAGSGKMAPAPVAT